MNMNMLKRSFLVFGLTVFSCCCAWAGDVTATPESCSAVAPGGIATFEIACNGGDGYTLRLGDAGMSARGFWKNEYVSAVLSDTEVAEGGSVLLTVTGLVATATSQQIAIYDDSNDPEPLCTVTIGSVASSITRNITVSQYSPPYVVEEADAESEWEPIMIETDVASNYWDAATGHHVIKPMKIDGETRIILKNKSTPRKPHMVFNVKVASITMTKESSVNYKSADYEKSAPSARVDVVSKFFIGRLKSNSKALFLGTACTSHADDMQASITNALNGVATVAAVKYRIYSNGNNGSNWSYKEGNIDQNGKMSKAQIDALRGNTDAGKTFLERGNHAAMEQFYQTLDKVVDAVNAGTESYDYIIFEFDGSLLGASESSHQNYSYDVSRVNKVSAFLKKYYDLGRVFWVVNEFEEYNDSDVSDTDSKKFPEQIRDTGYFRPVQWGKGKISENYWKSLLGLLNPDLYENYDSTTFETITFMSTSCMVGHQITGGIGQESEVHWMTYNNAATIGANIVKMIGDRSITAVVTDRINPDLTVNKVEYRLSTDKGANWRTGSYDGMTLSCGKDGDNCVTGTIRGMSYETWTKLSIYVEDKTGDFLVDDSSKVQWLSNDVNGVCYYDPNVNIDDVTQRGPAITKAYDAAGKPYAETNGMTSIAWAYKKLQFDLKRAEDAIKEYDGKTTNIVVEVNNPPSEMMIYYRNVGEETWHNYDPKSPYREVKDSTNVEFRIEAPFYEIYYGTNKVVITPATIVEPPYPEDPDPEDGPGPGTGPLPKPAPKVPWAAAYNVKKVYDGLGTNVIYMAKRIDATPTYRFAYTADAPKGDSSDWKDYANVFTNVTYAADGQTVEWKKVWVRVTAGDNYAPTNLQAYVKITPKNLDDGDKDNAIVADDKSIAYGEDCPDLTWYGGKGLVKGDGIKIVSLGLATTTPAKEIAKGVYAGLISTNAAIVITNSVGDNVTRNYEGFFRAGTFTVRAGGMEIGPGPGPDEDTTVIHPPEPEKPIPPADPNVEESWTNGARSVTKVYDGLPTNIVVRVKNPSKAVVRYSYDGKFFYEVGKFPGYTTVTNRAPVWYEAVDPAGNFRAVTNRAFVTINRKNLDDDPENPDNAIVADDKAIPYGAMCPKLTWHGGKGLVPGDGVKFISLAPTNGVDVSTLPKSVYVDLISTNAAIVITNSENVDVTFCYESFFKPGTLTVRVGGMEIGPGPGPEDTTVIHPPEPEKPIPPADPSDEKSWTNGARSVTKVYDGKMTNIIVRVEDPAQAVVRYSYDGMNFYEVGKFPGYTTVTNKAPVWYEAVDPDGNFRAVTNCAFVTIEPKNLDDGGEDTAIVADDKSIAYGDACPTLTWRGGKGLADGDSVKSVELYLKDGKDASKLAKNVYPDLITTNKTFAQAIVITNSVGADVTFCYEGFFKPGDFTVRAGGMEIGPGPGPDEDTTVIHPPEPEKPIPPADPNFEESWTNGARSVRKVYDGLPTNIIVRVKNPAKAVVRYGYDKEHFYEVGKFPGYTTVTNLAPVWYEAKDPAGNFRAVTNCAFVTIEPKNLDGDDKDNAIVADDKSIAYGDQCPTLTWHGGKGLVDGDGVESVKLYLLGGANASTLKKDVYPNYVTTNATVTQAIVITNSIGADVTFCYEGFFRPGTFTVRAGGMEIGPGPGPDEDTTVIHPPEPEKPIPPADPNDEKSWTNGARSVTKTYDGLSTNIIVRVMNPAKAVVRYSYDGSNFYKVGEFPGYTTVTNLAPVWYEAVDPAGNFRAITNCAFVTIKPKDLDDGDEDNAIVADDKSIAYGDACPTLTWRGGKGLADGDGVKSVELYLNDGKDASKLVKNVYPDLITTNKTFAQAIVITNSVGADVTFCYEGFFRPGTFTVYAGGMEIGPGPGPEDTTVIHPPEPEKPIPPADPNDEKSWTNGARSVTKIYDGLSTNIIVRVKNPANAVVRYSYDGLNFYEDGKFRGYTEVTNCAPVWYEAVDPEGNFRAITNRAFVTIEPKELTVTADPKTVAYGDTPPKYTTTITGFVNRELESEVVSGSADLTCEYTTATEPGTYTIVCRQGDLRARNYSFACVNGELTVNRAEIRYETEVPNVPYDGKGTNITVTVLTPNEPFKLRFKTPEGVWLDDLPPVYTNAGPYEITFVIEDGDRYTPITNTVTMIISPRRITLKSPNKVKIYDKTPLELFADEIMAGGMSFADGERFAFTDLASITEVGSTKATFLYGNGTALLANYEVEEIEYGKLRVKPNAEQILVRSASATWVYDGKAHGTNDWEIIGGNNLYDGDWVYVELEGDTVTTPDEGDVTNRIKVVTIYRGPEGDRGGSKDVTADYGEKLQIEEGILDVVNAKFSDPEVTPYRNYYDGAEHGIAVKLPSVTGVGIEYFDENDLAIGNRFLNVTNAVVRFRLFAPYYDDYFGESTVEIMPRKIVITSGDGIKRYDGGALETDSKTIKVVSGDFVGDEGFEVTDLGSQTEVGRRAADFSYALKSNTAPGNYDIEVDPGVLTVFDKDKLTVIATNDVHVYDGNAYSNLGFAVENLPAGDYEVRPEFSDDSVITLPGETANRLLRARVYSGETEVTDMFEDIVLLDGTLKVVKTQFSGVEAYSTNVVYDGKSYSIKVREPKILGAGPLTIEYSTTGREGPFSAQNPEFVLADPNGKPYEVYFRLSAPGYEDFVSNAFVRIVRRPITLRSGSAERCYDSAALSNDVVNVVNASDLADGHRLDAVTTSSQTGVGDTENAYDYQIKDNAGVEQTKNYDVKILEGTLAVSPFVLDVTFSAADKVYDGETNAQWIADGFAFTPAEGMDAMPDGEAFVLDRDSVNFWFDDPEVGEGHTVTAVSFSLKNVTGANEASKTGNYTFNFIQTAKAAILLSAPPPLDPADPPDEFPPESGPFNEDPGVEPPSPVDGPDPRPLSNFDTITVYDGGGHTFDYVALTNSIATNVWIHGVYGITYSLDGSNWTEGDTPFMFTNVVATSFWYKVTAPNAHPNYSNYVHAVGVTVTNRHVTVRASRQTMTHGDIDSLSPGFDSSEAWSVAPATSADDGLVAGDEVTFAALTFDRDISEYVPGQLNEGVIVTKSGEQSEIFSIVTSSTEENVTRNYLVSFEPGDLWVDENKALFKATLKWQYSGMATFYAAITIENTNRTDKFKYDRGSMRFCFADRKVNGVKICLWEWVNGGQNRELSASEEIGGVTYRSFHFADPDPSDILGGWRPNSPIHYGPDGSSKTAIEAFAAYNGKTPQLYRTDRKADFDGAFESCIGYLVWSSDGELQSIPLVADEELQRVLDSVSGRSSAPLSVSKLNQAAALGVQVMSDETPTCEISEFVVSETRIRGRVATRSGASVGVPSAGATVTLEGTDELGGEFRQIGSAVKISDGAFDVGKPTGCRFYRIRLDVSGVAPVFK